MLEVLSEDIASIVGSVFEATFGLVVERVDPAATKTEPMSSSLIGIAGSWDGAVIIECTPALAVSLAAIMFGVTERELAVDQLEDTLGELVNMIGGNFKALLPPPCTLSLPTVVEGKDYRVRVPGATIVRDLHFAIEGGFMRVLIAERGTGEGADATRSKPARRATNA